MKKILLAGGALLFALALSAAELRFKNIYGDNMVLQADRPNAIAGVAEPNASFDFSWKARSKDGKVLEKTVSLKADAKGKWETSLPAMPKRTVLEMTVSNGSEKAEVKNAVMGELWIGSGQSNMAWNFGAGSIKEDYRNKVRGLAKELEGDIRMFRVPNQTLAIPISEVQGYWEVVKPENINNASCVCFFFAYGVGKKLDTPMGMINTSWGGTRVEPWISKEAFLKSADCKNIWERHVKKLEAFAKIKANYNELCAQWYEANPTRNLQNKNGATRPMQPYDELNNTAPSAIYNAMVSGIAPLSPKGVLWYQGESNAGEPDEYGKLMKLLVTSWRKHFKTDFYFCYAELAAFQNKQNQPVQMYSWGAIREAQAEVLTLPYTGVGANADQDASPEPVGDIHPPHKDILGDRMARLALADVYKVLPKNEVTAPFYKSSKVEGNKMIIDVEFGTGLRKMQNAESFGGFAIRGDGNNKWLWADVEIKDGKLVVSNAEIQKPEAVRYGWAMNPILSVENKFGMPLRPFSTDHGSQLDYAHIKRD